MGSNKLDGMLQALRVSLSNSGLTTNFDDSIICPLCWQETRLVDLRVEHIVPSSVGGNARTLTCRVCNNDQGSSHDAMLSRFQTITDQFRGHGQLPVEVFVNRNRLAANLHWGEGHKHFTVVPKATNPRMNEAVQSEFRDGKFAELTVKWSYGYSQSSFQRSVLRVAYLALFRLFGYEYARRDVAQLLRQRISDQSMLLPNLGPMIIHVQNDLGKSNWNYIVIPGKINAVAFFLVIIRVQKITSSYVGVFMPVPDDGCREFFQQMDQFEQEWAKKPFTIPSDAEYWDG